MSRTVEVNHLENTPGRPKRQLSAIPARHAVFIAILPLAEQSGIFKAAEGQLCKMESLVSLHGAISAFGLQTFSASP